MSDFLMMRQNMAKGQILPENVVSSLLMDAFLTLSREKFVPHQLARMAYMDAHFPLGKGRFLLRPTLLAHLLHALNIKRSDKILYIAGGTGYGPALLSQMSHHIVALDVEETFTQETERLVNELHLSSIEVVLGPLIKGWEAQAPYDKILIEGCVEFIPRELATQLHDNGQLITIKHHKGKEKTAVKIEKKQGNFTENFLFDAFAPRLKPFREQKTFVF